MFNRKKTVIQKHEDASTKAFSLFSDTINKLTDANEDIKGDIDAAQDKINEAQEEKNILTTIRDRNDNLNKKISQFFDKI